MNDESVMIDEYIKANGTIQEYIDANIKSEWYEGLGLFMLAWNACKKYYKIEESE